MSESSENPLEASKPLSRSVEERLSDISQELGFIETPELVAAREALTPGDLIDKAIEKITAYHTLGAELVKAGEDKSPRPQIGLLVAVARLKYTNGFFDDYREDMTDLLFYSSSVGEHETYRKLRRITLVDLEDKWRERKS